MCFTRIKNINEDNPVYLQKLKDHVANDWDYIKAELEDFVFETSQNEDYELELYLSLSEIQQKIDEKAAINVWDLAETGDFEQSLIEQIKKFWD